MIFHENSRFRGPHLVVSLYQPLENSLTNSFPKVFSDSSIWMVPSRNVLVKFLGVQKPSHIEVLFGHRIPKKNPANCVASSRWVPPRFHVDKSWTRVEKNQGWLRGKSGPGPLKTPKKDATETSKAMLQHHHHHHHHHQQQQQQHHHHHHHHHHQSDWCWFGVKFVYQIPHYVFCFTSQEVNHPSFGLFSWARIWARWMDFLESSGSYWLPKTNGLLHNSTCSTVLVGMPPCQ